ncbi:hypothetical protein LIER_17698 [Lithospermum erythrorhizon]|uniref:Uncharacterized protein n=1 Tax=Lithospermum erythrorhizon TaxID=34254 RepID=A0AAV3QGT9_LITER
MSLFKNIGIFLLVISASLLLSTSFAGRTVIVNNNSAKQAGSVHEVQARETSKPISHEDLVHERLLRVNTKDYGRYDPAPSFAKPRFKLIPN